MPHGTPDWGLVGPKTTTYGVDDLGEHAVRMGFSSHAEREAIRAETSLALAT